MTLQDLPSLSKTVYEAMADKTIKTGLHIQVKGYGICDVVGYAKDKNGHFRNITRFVNKDNNGVITANRDTKLFIIGNPVRLGDVLQWIEGKSVFGISNGEYEEDLREDIKDIIFYRPKDHLSAPIPLDPDESWRKLLELLVSLIEGGQNELQ